MTENQNLRDEIMKGVKDYVDSDEFNDKIKKFTQKTIKETVACVWKYWGSLIAIIIVLLGYIFTTSQSAQDNKTDRIAKNQLEIIKIVAKLEERTK